MLQLPVQPNRSGQTCLPFDSKFCAQLQSLSVFPRLRVSQRDFWYKTSAQFLGGNKLKQSLAPGHWSALAVGQIVAKSIVLQPPEAAFAAKA
jgi:hypothetical protein